MAVERLAAHQERAGQVRLHHRSPALERDHLRRADELAAGVVDQAVQAAALGQHEVEQRRHLLFFANVTDEMGGRAARRVNLGRHPFQILQRARRQDDVRAERGQFMGRRPADARAAAGDEDSLPVE